METSFAPSRSSIISSSASPTATRPGKSGIRPTHPLSSSYVTTIACGRRASARISGVIVTSVTAYHCHIIIFQFNRIPPHHAILCIIQSLFGDS